MVKTYLPNGLAALALAALLLAALPTTGGAQEPPNATSAGAIALRADAATHVDTLLGNRGGAFRYFQFDYPGAFVPVVLRLSCSPGLSALPARAFGLNLYAPDGGSSRGVATDDATIELRLATAQPGRYLVQVYNYAAGTPVHFELSASGLTLGEVPPVAPNDAPERALQLPPPSAAVTQHLTGAADGAASYYTLVHPGGDEPLAVTLNYAPLPRLGTDAVGINLYRDGKLIVQGSEAGRDEQGITLSAVVASPAPAIYGLQVTNYSPGDTISYVLEASGLAAPPAPASGNTTPDRALALRGTAGATGSLVGNRAGAFNFYTVVHPGGGKTLTLAMSIPSPGGAPGQALGFNVYQDGRLVGQATAGDDGTGLLYALWRYTASERTSLGVQVFNYGDGARSEYLLYAIGAE